MPWPLPYILVIGSFLLAVFLLLGTVLVVRNRHPRMRHRSPGGYLGYRQVNPHALAQPYLPKGAVWEFHTDPTQLEAGIERARGRQYYGKGRE